TISKRDWSSDVCSSDLVMKILLEHYHHVIDEKGKDFNFPARLFNTFYFDGPHYIMPMKVSYDGDEDIITYSRKIVGKTNPIQARSEERRVGKTRGKKRG